MATKNPKFTDEDIKKHIAKIQELTKEAEKQQKPNHHVTVVTPEEIDRKLRRVNSPMIVSQGWTSSAPAGGVINYSVGLYNPDPTQAIWLFGHVFIGSGNPDPVTGTFLLNVDDRFPRLTQPDFAGLNIPAGGSASLSYSIVIPANVQKTNYLGNTALMQFNWHDIGTLLDRSVFVFKVT
jgi:hypothetical protein